MKNKSILACSLTLTLTSTLCISTPASAKPKIKTAERCAMPAYDLGLSDGADGGKYKQGKAFIESCRALSIKFDAAAYRKGLADKAVDYCTAKKGQKHNKANWSPDFICRDTANPYMDAYRDNPLYKRYVKNPLLTAYDADYADSALKSDIDFLDMHIDLLREKFSEGLDMSPDWANIELQIQSLKKRQKILKQMLASSRADYLKLHDDPTAHLPIAEKWKDPNRVKWAKMKKKDCKSGNFEDYGYRLAASGRHKSEKLPKALKKCRKAKVEFDYEAFERGYKKGAARYCGFEMGLSDARYGSLGAEACEDYPSDSYNRGFSYGLMKYENNEKLGSAQRQIQLREQFISHFGNVWPNRPMKAGSREAKWRKAYRAYLGNDYARLKEEDELFKAHKEKTPGAFETFLYGQHEKPDSVVKYTIPAG